MKTIAPDVPAHVGRYCQRSQDHILENALDSTTLLDFCRPALRDGTPVLATLPIRNVHRAVGTRLGSEVTRQYGPAGLPHDTIQLNFEGSAGQSFGAFIPKGITLRLEGDSNDYVGKGLSGGKVVVVPPRASTFTPQENVIIGNVAFYGATAGEAYINGTDEFVTNIVRVLPNDYGRVIADFQLSIADSIDNRQSAIGNQHG